MSFQELGTECPDDFTMLLHWNMLTCSSLLLKTSLLLRRDTARQNRRWPDMLQTTWKARITRTGDWVLERFRHVETFFLLGRVATGGCWSTDSSPFCDVTPPAWLASCRPDGRWPDMSRGAVANTLGFIWSAKIHEVDVRLYSKRDLKRLSQTLGFISETRHCQLESNLDLRTS